MDSRRVRDEAIISAMEGLGRALAGHALPDRPTVSDAIYGPKFRCVYFIREGEEGPIKIGWTDRPKRRLHQLQSGNPRPLRVVALMEGGVAEERRLHRTFAAARMRGEWFQATAELIDFINEKRRAL